MILDTFESTISNYHKSILVQGTVVDNVDPLHKSRIRVKIQGMTDQLPVDKLPWYLLSLGVHNSGSNVPPIGSRVLLYYTDIYNSIVLGSIVSITAK